MTPETQRQLKQLLDKAFRAFEAGDDEAARQFCREALLLDPDSSTAHSLMGLLYEREGATEAATGAFARVVSQNPGSIADVETLARLRGRQGVVADVDSEADRSNATIVGVAAVAAVIVFVGVAFGAMKLTNWFQERGASGNLVASANLEEDLALAREAFEAGRYETAMSAAQRVLRADPGNAVAREIYERAKAFLDSTQQPAVPRTEAPAPAPSPAPRVESEPAIPRPATGGQAVTVSPAPVVPRPSTTATTRAGSGQPWDGRLPAVTTPSESQTGQLRLQLPPLRLDTSYSGKPGTTVRRRAPTYDTSPYYQSERPATSGGNTARSIGDSETGRDDQPKPYIKVEVRQAEPTERRPADEVKPGEEPVKPTAAAPDKQPTDPAVEEWRAQQERLRQAKARMLNPEGRRVEREQGQ